MVNCLVNGYVSIQRNYIKANQLLVILNRNAFKLSLIDCVEELIWHSFTVDNQSETCLAVEPGIDKTGLKGVFGFWTFANPYNQGG